MQYSNALFRPEAIEGQKRNTLGNAMLLPKTNHQLLALVLLCWFLLLCAWLFTSNYTSKATVNGWLVSTKPSVDIVAKEANGSIQFAYVGNGQSVMAGDVLLNISRNAASLVKANNRLQVNSLKESNALLQERKRIVTKQIEQEKIHNDRLVLRQTEHLNLALARMDSLQAQLSDIKEEEQNLYTLWQSKLIAKAAYSAQKDKRLSIQRQLEQQQINQLNTETHLLALQQNIISSSLESQQVLNSIASESEQIKREIQRVESLDSYLIKSPIDGIVHNLQTSAGEPIVSGAPLMQITPLNNPLTAKLFVPSNHAGFVKVNQEVNLKMNAFPYQKFGTLDATITHVSQHILLPSEVKRKPMQLSEPIFIIEAQLKSEQINANGEPVELKAGMLFQAEVVLSKRTLWQWLLSPIHSLKGAFA